jgi:hypothetical protein
MLFMSKYIPVHVSIKVQAENRKNIEIHSTTLDNQVFVSATGIEKKGQTSHN